MTFHLFGNVLTHYGSAANNRGENEGNITTLQKLMWKSQIHTTVSAEAIRWALRYQWQQMELPINRRWDDDRNDNVWQNPAFSDVDFVDDDVLGFMRAEAAKEEANAAAETPDEGEAQTKGKGKKPAKPKGTTTAKRGVLEVTRAVSTRPYEGDITFNAASGKKNRTSLYGTEVHATRYQYGFALTPNRLKDRSRTLAVLDGLTSLSDVAGNQSRFLYDFSPDSIVLRWTHDFAPRLLYCLTEQPDGTVSATDLLDRVRAGDINPEELWIGGSIVQTGVIPKDLGINLFDGVVPTTIALKAKISSDLNLG